MLYQRLAKVVKTDKERNLRDRSTDTTPTATQMGKVYKRLILNTIESNEDYADAILRVYNNPICTVIDNYNASAYYEPSPYIARSYYAGGFV